MPTDPTTRFGLVIPEGTDDVFEIRETFEDNLPQLEALAAGWLEGSAGSRPAASEALAGFFYKATDTGVWSVCDGSAWFALRAGDLPHREVIAYTRDEDQVWPAAGKVVGSFVVRPLTGETKVLEAVETYLHSGSGTVFKMQKSAVGTPSWSDVTGFTGISPDNDLDLFDPDDVAISSPTAFRVVVTTQGSGKGGHIQPVIKTTL